MLHSNFLHLVTSSQTALVTQWYYITALRYGLTLHVCASPLGLMGREPARQTSEPSSNPNWDATVHPVCETFNVMRVV